MIDVSSRQRLLFGGEPGAMYVRNGWRTVVSAAISPGATGINYMCIPSPAVRAKSP